VNAESVLRIVLYVVLIGLSGTAIWALVHIVGTARSTRTLADDVDRSLVPLMDKANLTLDALNAEILKVDGIVAQIEEVSDRVGATTRGVEGVLGAPVAAVSGLGSGVRRFFSVLVGRRL
jgi:hypothetical protein